MTGTMDKRKLLQSIRDARMQLETTIAAIPEAQMVRASVEGGNSVKDLLAHISIWERRMIEWLSVSLQDREPEMLPEGMTWDDLDQWNEETTLSLRKRSLLDVLEEFGASYQDALRAVEETAEETLIDPHRFAWRDGKPLWEMISANMDWHYLEHEKSIRAWLESLTEN